MLLMVLEKEKKFSENMGVALFVSKGVILLRIVILKGLASSVHNDTIQVCVQAMNPLHQTTRL